MKHLLIAILTLTFALPSFTALASLNRTEVSQLYVGVFGRASEGEGNSYWQYDAQSSNMISTTNVMLDTEPAKAYFGSTLFNNHAFIEHIYLNTLGKTYSQDPTGINYWVSELNAGKSKGEVISALIVAAQYPGNAGAAQDQFNNKVEVSNYCAKRIYDYDESIPFAGFIENVIDDMDTVADAKRQVDSIADGMDEPLNTTTTSETVDSSGGSIVVPADDPLIAGTTLSIPKGALNSETVLTIQAEPVEFSPSTLKQAAESNGTLYTALVDYAMDNLDTGVVHPMWGPLLTLSSSKFAGPVLRLGPNHLTFKTPITVSVPLDVLSIPSNNNAIPILQSSDGTWEMVNDFEIDLETGLASAQISHFSKFAHFIPVIGPLLDSLDASADAINNIMEEYFPEDLLKEFVKETVCSGIEIDGNLENVIDEWDLLGELYQGATPGSGGNDQDNLRNWLESQKGNVPNNSITFAKLFSKALEQQNGNVYKALATTNGLLSYDRGSKVGVVNTMVEKFRPDGKDPRGARYHFFGAALHAFVHEYHKDQDYIPNYYFDPVMMVTFEESLVSRDIISDTTEWAVDLKGADLGRKLFHEMHGSSRKELIEKFSLSGEKCLEPDLNSSPCPMTYDPALDNPNGVSDDVGSGYWINNNTQCTYEMSLRPFYLRSEIPYLEGKKHGLVKSYRYKSSSYIGTVQSTTNFDHGEADIRIYYDELGQQTSCVYTLASGMATNRVCP